MNVKTLEQAREQVWRVTEFKGEICLMYLAASVPAGPCATVTGEIVNVTVPTGLWSGCSLFPRFANESEALACANANGLQLANSQL